MLKKVKVMTLKSLQKRRLEKKSRKKKDNKGRKGKRRDSEKGYTFFIPLSVIFNLLINISIIIGRRSVENEKRKKKRRRKVRMLFQKTKKK